MSVEAIKELAPWIIVGGAVLIHVLGSAIEDIVRAAREPRDREGE